MTSTALAREWSKRLTKADDRVAVAQLYRGRGFRTVIREAARHGVTVNVLSAGLGVLGLSDMVPPYSLSVTPDSKDSILAKISDSPLPTAGDWWKSIARMRGVTTASDLLESNKSALVVFGVSSSYLSMIADELVDLDDRDRRRVRIVGPKHLINIAEVLRPLVMPYDTRLNGPDSKARGTEFDFAQRALASFVRLVHSDTTVDSAANHVRRVRLSLSPMRTPRKVSRKRVTDKVLKEHIRIIKKSVSSVSEGLRTLRKKRSVACEQSRFSRLWAT